MKHFSRITLVMMFLSLLLSIEATAQTQRFPQVKQNIDGSYDQFEIKNTFESFIDTVKNLPKTEEQIQFFVRAFWEYLDINTDDYVAIIRIGDENSRELDSIEGVELYSECISLLKEKERFPTPNSNQQNEPSAKPKRTKKLTQVAIIISIGFIVALIFASIVFLLYKSRKKNKSVLANDSQFTNASSTKTSNNSGTSDVIVRRKTSSVLHKQSLDDVVNNSNYMVINCSDFSNDTAVKTMYIKNSCIMDIYNMYADDLRNPNNPKEDGCMVLGRWVHDEKLDEYAVSLEEFVKPGNDAIFAEYELDFGGKIKVIINEKLRKLRRETNLQYDLTCWVHSHPGLGVFFSNTDCNLHLLHKHPTHPKFLTAIVVDILTPQEELGIFTFKHDMNINSKADLKQFYSLEEWYKWAVESKRNSISFEEHYNTLEKAKLRNNQCYNVQLSNNPIIDIEKIAINQDYEHLYFVHGFSIQQSDQITSMADIIKSVDTLADNELIGCFMVVTHRSYPTIKKTVADYLDKIKFVLVYSIANGMLTTIPVIANDLCTDESYYGEQPLEELKIWTRRKR